ncbi:MAG: hypothetical protein R3C13_06995 [Hyphomonas sp.]|uniref:hypothetical protein n=1 Tax=Hyphomonas sp. TaxID=87 RepID=UPI0035291DD1
MSHAYPLGKTVEDALKPEAKAARTRAEAEAAAGGLKVAELATDWLSVTEEAADAMLSAAGAFAHGHLQRYEDDQGNPVVAVTWWKLETEAAGKRKAAKAAKAKPATPAPAEPADHTDDLYFRRGRTKPSRRRYVDPRQLDLFRQPKDTA